MKIHRAYKVELDPNNCQRTLFLKSAGSARVAWNWGLRQKIDSYEKTGKSLNAIALHRELNKLKKVSKEDGGFPWMRETSKCAPQEALRDLDKAFRNFFRRCKQGAPKKGFPRFKSRNRGIGSFRLTGTIRASAKHVQLPRIGQVRLKERGYLPAPNRKDMRTISATVSERTDRWFVSFAVEQEVGDPTLETYPVVGVDVGIKHLAVTSDGDVFENPRALKKAESRTRRLQQSVSRKKKGSNNRKKAVRLLAQQHYRVSNIRKDAIHKATTAIATRASVIGIETLNVKGMLKNRCLSKALSDASLSEFLRQLKYKAAWRGVKIVEADRWFPSSKTCSRCGHVKKDLALGDRTYRCDECGLEVDRDLNAALNLKLLAVSSTVTACGEDVRPDPLRVGKAASMKQEPNTKAA